MLERGNRDGETTEMYKEGLMKLMTKEKKMEKVVDRLIFLDNISPFPDGTRNPEPRGLNFKRRLHKVLAHLGSE